MAHRPGEGNLFDTDPLYARACAAWIIGVATEDYTFGPPSFTRFLADTDRVALADTKLRPAMLEVFVAEVHHLAKSARGAALGLDADVIEHAFADVLHDSARDFYSGPSLWCTDLVDVTCEDVCDWVAAFETPHRMDEHDTKSRDVIFAFRAEGDPPDVLEECTFFSRPTCVKEEPLSDGSGAEPARGGS